MTPPARVSASIAILDAVLAGAPAERELTRWGRAARHAGSGDRRAVRDLVFDALRRLRSAAWQGGHDAPDGWPRDARLLMAGLLHGRGEDAAALFDGSRHGPAPLGAWSPRPRDGAPRGVRLDLPDWLLPSFDRALGGAADAVLEALRERAPVTLRANLARTSRAALIEQLRGEGVAARPHPLSPSAVVLGDPAPGLAAGAAFAAGLFEMQDAASQAAVDRLPATGGRVLDLCAGGGGKALALAARDAGAEIWAHDAAPDRMRDLPARARRAGVALRLCARPEAEAPFDGVICDLPCSGSGAWRRSPEAKWRLGPERLTELRRTQREIVRHGRALLRPGGWLAVMTCSLLDEENEGAVAAAEGAEELLRWRCTPLEHGADGFFLCLLRAAGP